MYSVMLATITEHKRCGPPIACVAVGSHRDSDIEKSEDLPWSRGGGAAKRLKLNITTGATCRAQCRVWRAGESWWVSVIFSFSNTAEPTLNLLNKTT